MDGGGSERQTLMLLQRLDRTIWKPHLLLLHRRGVLLDQVPPDIPVTAFNDRPRENQWWFPGRIHRQQIHWMKETIRQIRPVVMYDRTYHTALISGQVIVPRFSVITSPPDLELVGSREKWIAIKRRVLRRAYRSAAITAAVSHCCATAAERFYGLPKDSIQVWPSPIDAHAIRESAKLALPFAMPTDQLNITCVGRLTEEKGQGFLLRAIDLVRRKWPESIHGRAGRPIHFWFAGDGPLRKELESLSRQLALEDQVTFLGHLPQAERLIARSNLLCSPSRYEGLPNVVMEGMALGVPIIATSVGGTKELDPTEVCLNLVTQEQPEALATKILEVLSHPRWSQDRATAGIELMSARDPDTYYQNLSKELLRICRR
jgi:glycosyltransferase involved in cell wall biosynthesis